MHQLQVAAEAEDRRSQRIKAADIIESPPAAVADTDGIEQRGLCRAHAQAAEVAGRFGVPHINCRQPDQVPKRHCLIAFNNGGPQVFPLLAAIGLRHGFGHPVGKHPPLFMYLLQGGRRWRCPAVSVVPDQQRRLALAVQQAFTQVDACRAYGRRTRVGKIGQAQIELTGVVRHQRAPLFRRFATAIEQRHAHGAHFERRRRLPVAWARVDDGHVPTADPLRLFDQGDVLEAATQQLAGGSQTGNAGTDDANAVLGATGLGDTTDLLEQPAVVETQIGRVGEPRRPAFGITRQGGRNISGMVVGGTDSHGLLSA